AEVGLVVRRVDLIDRVVANAVMLEPNQAARSLFAGEQSRRRCHRRHWPIKFGIDLLHWWCMSMHKQNSSGTAKPTRLAFMRGSISLSGAFIPPLPPSTTKVGVPRAIAAGTIQPT